MATLKLYGYPNHRVTKSQVAALYSGVDVQYLGFEIDRNSDEWKARVSARLLHPLVMSAV